MGKTWLGLSLSIVPLALVVLLLALPVLCHILLQTVDPSLQLA